MILDFARHYPTIQEFFELNGHSCGLCNKPYNTPSSYDGYYYTINCTTCKWTAEFEQDAHKCQKLRNFYHKGFAFATDVAGNLHIREVKDNFYRWGVFKKNTTMIAMRTLMAIIRTGECREACARIRQAEEAKIKLLAAKRAAEIAVLGEAINNVVAI